MRRERTETSIEEETEDNKLFGQKMRNYLDRRWKIIWTEDEKLFGQKMRNYLDRRWGIIWREDEKLVGQESETVHLSLGKCIGCIDVLIYMFIHTIYICYNIFIYIHI